MALDFVTCSAVDTIRDHPEIGDVNVSSTATMFDCSTNFSIMLSSPFSQDWMNSHNRNNPHPFHETNVVI